MLFQKVSKEFNHKPNKIWADKDWKFFKRSMKSWLEENAIEMYSKHNQGKSVIAERFIKSWKNKIYKSMTSISKNVYIDKLDDTVNKCTNMYHKTFSMKPVNVKSSTCVDFNKIIREVLNLKFVIMLECEVISKLVWRSFCD